jgi:peptide/nickel transport system substrate-binding protein
VLFVALAAVALLLLLSLLPGIGAEGRTGPSEGGRLIEAVPGPATRVNPLDATSTAAERDLSMLVFAGLTRPGPDGAPLPVLAESWTVSADARVFTFRLRNGIKWHDGREITADDVLFTHSMLGRMGDRADPRLREVWLNATVTRTGRDAVQVELPEPFAPLPSHASFALLPWHLLRDVPPEQLATHEFFRMPVGAGPFKLRTLTAEGAVLDRFDDYAQGPPWLSGVELRFAAGVPPLTPGTSAARAGLYQGTINEPAGVHSVVAAGSAYTMVLLNHRDPLFSDVGLRRALAAAAHSTVSGSDRRQVVTDTPFVPGWWAAGGPSGGAADAGSAEQLLRAGGWVRGTDGILVRDGRPLVFSLLTPIRGGRPEVARRLADAWNALGARVTVNQVEDGALARDFLNPRMYQAALVTLDPGPDPDPFGAWHSSLADRPDANLGDVSDAELDRLAEQGRRAPSVAARRDVYQEFARRFREVAPAIVLFADSWTYQYRSPLAGIDLRALASAADRYAGIHRWYDTKGR